MLGSTYRRDQKGTEEASLRGRRWGGLAVPWRVTDSLLQQPLETVWAHLRVVPITGRERGIYTLTG